MNKEISEKKILRSQNLDVGLVYTRNLTILLLFTKIDLEYLRR